MLSKKGGWKAVYTSLTGLGLLVITGAGQLLVIRGNDRDSKQVPFHLALTSALLSCFKRKGALYCNLLQIMTDLCGRVHCAVVFAFAQRFGNIFFALLKGISLAFEKLVYFFFLRNY